MLNYSIFFPRINLQIFHWIKLVNYYRNIWRIQVERKEKHKYRIRSFIFLISSLKNLHLMMLIFKHVFHRLYNVKKDVLLYSTDLASFFQVVFAAWVLSVAENASYDHCFDNKKNKYSNFKKETNKYERLLPSFYF